jgi:fluoride exporter
MLQFALVFLGGGVGAAGRHGVNVAAQRLIGIDFPWGTLIVNIVGSLAMGLIAGWFAFKADAGLSQHARLFLTTGMLGGFTTFSAFSLDAVLLWERGAAPVALAYVLASVGVSIAGLVAGLAVVRAFA